jgi:hypothetical protein
MPKNKKQNSVATNDDGLDGMGATLKAIQERARARYDGVLGTLPDWVPRNFHNDFEGARGRVLDEGYKPEVVQALITERMKSLRAVYTRPFIPSPIPRDIRTFFRDINTLARIKTAVAMRKVKGLAFLTDPIHATRVLKGERFASGGSAKKGKEYEPRASIRKLCAYIRSVQLGDVLQALRDPERCNELYESTSDPIGVLFMGVHEDEQKITYLRRGDLPNKQGEISFKTLTNILTKIKK